MSCAHTCGLLIDIAHLLLVVNGELSVDDKDLFAVEPSLHQQRCLSPLLSKSVKPHRATLSLTFHQKCWL